MLHAVCDENDSHRVPFLTSGTLNDCRVPKRCIEVMPPCAVLVADNAFASRNLREWLKARCMQLLTSPRKRHNIQYDCDEAVYYRRNIIGRMFSRLRDCRRATASTTISKPSWVRSPSPVLLSGSYVAIRLRTPSTAPGGC
jgi:transposase